MLKRPWGPIALSSSATFLGFLDPVCVDCILVKSKPLRGSTTLPRENCVCSFAPRTGHSPSRSLRKAPQSSGDITQPDVTMADRRGCLFQKVTNQRLGGQLQAPCFIWPTHCFANQETSHITLIKHRELSPAPLSLGEGRAHQWTPNFLLTFLPTSVMLESLRPVPLALRPPWLQHDPLLWRRCLGKPYLLTSTRAPTAFHAHPPPPPWLALRLDSYLCECCQVFPGAPSGFGLPSVCAHHSSAAATLPTRPAPCLLNKHSPWARL